jgi:hypothetical protein
MGGDGVGTAGSAYASPTRPGRAHSIVAAALSVAFIAATAVLAFVVHRGGSNAAGSGGLIPVGVGPSQPTTSALASTPTPTDSAAQPMDPEAVNQVFGAYLNALLHHDLRALKDATCPRLRHTEVGVELHRKYVRAWRGKPYDLTPGLSFVRVRALVDLTDASTGEDAGQAVYQWNVQRNHGGRYFVCGFLS